MADKYIDLAPKEFDARVILVYLNAMDTKLVKAEIEYDNVKNQVQEVFDFVVSEKMHNESLSATLAKVKATNDHRYMKVKKLLSDAKSLYLFAKVQAKNAHSYCDNLKQQSINQLAIDKLTLKH